ncbi:hypothetical protein [Phytoactinopolyspora limicola]|uniref:hypothetical protein n=1 Tax=Phytoactinopolyspora limicola TaxID=2715536 RepID=UPI00140AFAAD|nr:hypothetical protein [Phytoactinopolyspora limicola]
MQFLYNVLVVFHFIGLASLLGGCMVQMTTSKGERVVNAAILHGVMTQLVTGVLLVGMQEMADSLNIDPDHAKVGVKLAVAAAIAVLAFANRRRTTITDGVYGLLFALSLGNVLVAVFW